MRWQLSKNENGHRARAVQIQKAPIYLWGHDLLLFQVAAAFQPAFSPCALDENPPHGLRSSGKEMAPIVPIPALVVTGRR